MKARAARADERPCTWPHVHGEQTDRVVDVQPRLQGRIENGCRRLNPVTRRESSQQLCGKFGHARPRVSQRHARAQPECARAWCQRDDPQRTAFDALAGRLAATVYPEVTGTVRSVAAMTMAAHLTYLAQEA